jgi:hypothetical protein
MKGPDIRHGFRRLRRAVTALVGIAVVVVGLAYGFIPSFRSEINSLITQGKSHFRNALPSYPQVYPISVSANMHEHGHPAGSAMDNRTNNYWLAPWHAAREPVLTARFSHKVTLVRIIIWSGAAGDYVANGRPSALHLMFSNGHTETLIPKDTPNMQTLDISGARGVDSVQIQITGIYQGINHADVAISEISWFRLQL